MPSTPTTRLKIEKQALGENSATWGAPKLNDAFDRIDEAIAGVEAISTSGGTTTLTSTNYATDQARKAVLVISGTLASAATIVVPALEKVYLCINNCTLGSYSVTIKTALGAGVVLPAGPYLVYCNGTSVFSGTPRLDGLGTAGGTINMGGYRVTNSATPTATTDLATKAYVDAAVVAGGNDAALAALQASVDSAVASLAPKASPTFTSGITLSTGVLTVPLGTVGSPSYTFAGDTNTGVYSSGADSVSLVAGGTARATASTSGLGVTGAVTTSGAASIGTTLGVTGATTLGSTLAVTGALTAASVASSGALSGTTLAASGAATLSSTLGVTGAVTASSTVTAGGVILGPAGSVSAPSHSFSGDTNTGMYGPGSDILRFATGGTDRLAIDASGNVGVAFTTPPAYTDHRALVVKGAGTGLGYATVRVEAGANSKQGIFQISGTDGDVAVGTDALTNTTGTLTLFAGGAARTQINSLGYLRQGQFSTNTPGYSGDTTVGGCLWPDGRIFLSGSSFSGMNLNADGAVMLFNRSGVNVGNISVTTTAAAYNTSSDYRLKTDIEPLTGALDRLSKLKPSRFRFKSEKPNAKKVDGFLAHEVEAIVPEAVTGKKDGDEMQGLDKSRIVPLAVAAIQELVARVEVLEKAAGKAK